MRSYSESYVFAARARALLSAATGLIASIPDPISQNREWRCHEIARAIGERLRLDVIDGRFGGVEHSWLLVSDGCIDRSAAILDVYAVGALPQVRLLDPRSPEGLLFVEGPERADVRYEDEAALARVFEPCDHPNGFLGRTTREGAPFCELCGECR